ncbi:tRNA dimethylallyltransferase isoform X2 [Vespula squamosa]|uniref:tRNA dimethylallyltransferase isoform X2 n=1 Tax=Vespula squamosa TaxID=30214 RepID=A0ABD2ADH5_VESSQ
MMIMTTVIIIYLRLILMAKILIEHIVIAYNFDALLRIGDDPVSLASECRFARSTAIYFYRSMIVRMAFSKNIKSSDPGLMPKKPADVSHPTGARIVGRKSNTEGERIDLVVFVSFLVGGATVRLANKRQGSKERKNERNEDPAISIWVSIDDKSRLRRVRVERYRSLEVFEQYGITHSEILKTQRLAGGSGLGGPLRYPNSIILWLRCDKVEKQVGAAYARSYCCYFMENIKGDRDAGLLYFSGGCERGWQGRLRSTTTTYFRFRKVLRSGLVVSIGWPC